MQFHADAIRSALVLKTALCHEYAATGQRNDRRHKARGRLLVLTARHNPMHGFHIY